MGNCLFAKRGCYATTDQKLVEASVASTGADCDSGGTIATASASLATAKVALADGSSPVQMRALYAFEKQADDDLAFRKDDILDLVDNSSGEFWWLMRNQRTGESGYVPCNYIQPYDGGPTSLAAWFDVDRREAERCLLMPGVLQGSFVLRPCGQRSEQGAYSLSVRTADEEQPHQQQQPVLVRHYIVRPTDQGGFYISPNRRFDSMQDLLLHYQSQQDGMCCRLTLACPREYVPPPQLRDFELSRKQLTFIEKLGQGSFGEVWKAKLGRLVEVAVKSMKEATMNKADFLSEAEKMHKLHHPKIVQLVGVCTREEPFYIVTEFMPNGALTAYLRRDNEEGGRKVTFGHMIDMLFQVADGMCYLEAKRFIHRDLRGANILVGLSNTVKVGDFGLSRCIEEEAYCFKEGTKFPIRWTAPEAAKSKAFTHKSDVWSFGVLAYEVVTRGGLPYPEFSNCDILRAVSTGYRMPNPHCDAAGIPCDEFLYTNVMLASWQLDPTARPTFAAVRNSLENYFVEKQPQYEQ